MKPRTTRETAMICLAAVLAVGLLIIPFSLTPAKTDTAGLLLLAAAGVAALGLVLGYRYLAIRKRAQIELTGGEQYR
jgi:hypothetical protein